MLTSLSNCFEWLSFAQKFASLCSAGSLPFLSINISEGSVATPFRCGGIVNPYFARNLLLRLSMKEF